MNIVSIANFIFVGCIFLCIAYDLIQRGLLEKMPALKPEAKADLILAILGAYVLTATLRLDQIDRNLQNVLPSPANQYDRALRDYVSFLQAGSRNRQITFSNRYESMAALLRSIDTSRRSYEALNLYTSGWNEEMKDVYEASVAAVRRKVNVWRCFVVRDQYVSGEFEAQVEAMERQHEEGIDVFWVKESDLKKMPYFRENPVRSMALVDSEWLLVDTSPADRSSSPTETKVTWITDEVARNPFSQLKTYGYIKHFKKADLVKLQGEGVKLGASR